LKYSSVGEFTTFKESIAIAVTAAAWGEIWAVFSDELVVDKENRHV